MAQENSGGVQLQNAFENVISKVSEFLDIFDLSFFVSGVVSFSAIYFGLYNLVKVKSSIEMLKNPIVIIVSSYVLGMIGFALGRWIKRNLSKTFDIVTFVILITFLGIAIHYELEDILGKWIVNVQEYLNPVIRFVCCVVMSGSVLYWILKLTPSERCNSFIKELNLKAEKSNTVEEYKVFDKQIKTMIEEHGLEKSTIIKAYLDRKKNADDASGDISRDRILYKLYVRLWAVMRESDKKESYKLIKRYWVLNAVYDGLLLSSTLWFVVLVQFVVSKDTVSVMYIGSLGVVFIAIFTSCLNESKRLEEYQMQELIASLAYIGTEMDN